MAGDYVPPKVWQWKQGGEGLFAAMNRPIAGATHDAGLPVGQHPFQLYSLGTPNGNKVTILFEELLAAGYPAEYDAWLIHILKAEQFSSGFVAVNPNSKIPALVDRSGAVPFRVFESGAILLHLADKFDAFIPVDPAARAECLSWLFWQMASMPFISSGFGHFYHYAPVKLEYAIDRYAMETKRLFDVADRRLAESRYLAGAQYSIADMALFPWFKPIMAGEFYGEAPVFLGLDHYRNIARWAEEIGERNAVQRGLMVNSIYGPPEKQLHERHAASDFETSTQDKIGPEGDPQAG